MRDCPTANIYGNVDVVRTTVGIFCAAVAAVIILATLLILYREGKELMGMKRAIRHLCDCLRKTIDDIGRIWGEMAQSNIAVDVVKNESYYNDDSRILAESLKSIRTQLTNVMSDITDITSQIQNCTVRCSNASDLVDKAADYAAEADTKIEQLISRYLWTKLHLPASSSRK